MIYIKGAKLLWDHFQNEEGLDFEVLFCNYFETTSILNRHKSVILSTFEPLEMRALYKHFTHHGICTLTGDPRDIRILIANF